MFTVTRTFSVRKQIISAIVFTCILKSVHLQQCNKLSFNKKHFGQRLVGFIIVSSIEESIGTCAKKCFQLTHCLSTNFDTVSKQCDLNNITADEMTTAVFKSTTSVLSNLSAWPKAMVPSCGDKPCNEREICLPAGNSFLCRNSDCPKAPLIVQATSTGSVAIGGKMVYKCTNPLHRILGQDYVHCGWMNTWSSNTEITCTAEYGGGTTTGLAYTGPFPTTSSTTAAGGGGTTTGLAYTGPFPATYSTTAAGGGGTPSGTACNGPCPTTASTTAAGVGGTTTGPVGTVPSPTTSSTTAAGSGGTPTGPACNGPCKTTASTTAAGVGGTTTGPVGTVPSQTTASTTAAGVGGTTTGPVGTGPSQTTACTTAAGVGGTTTGPVGTVPSPTTASTTAAGVGGTTTGPAGTGPSPTTASTTAAGVGGTTTGPAGTGPSQTTASTTAAGGGGTTTVQAGTVTSQTTASTTAEGGSGTTTVHAGTGPSPTTVSTITADCGDPTPAYGTSSSNIFTYQTTLTISCDPGYVLSGPTSITCQADGTWSSNPTCELKDCGDPTPAYGTSSSNIFTYQTSLTVSCDPSYVLSGLPGITCQADGTWSSNPTCELKACYDSDTKQMYVGHYDKTQSGKTCQRWDSQTPHEHNNNDVARFPDVTLADAANYCRDPENDKYLWCYTTDTDLRWEKCGMSRCECYTTDTAQGYTGTWNVTKTGKQCQRWDSNTPHSNTYNDPSRYPEHIPADEGNYCRDPGNDGYIWCYTTDPGTKWQECDIEKCSVG